MTEDAEDSARFPQLVEHQGPISVRPYAIARLDSKYMSMAVDQMRSVSASDSSSTRRPAIETTMRAPPTRPMTAAGTPSLAARASSSAMRAALTDTTTRDADSPNIVTTSPN